MWEELLQASFQKTTDGLLGEPHPRPGAPSGSRRPRLRYTLFSLVLIREVVTMQPKTLAHPMRLIICLVEHIQRISRRQAMSLNRAMWLHAVYPHQLWWQRLDQLCRRPQVLVRSAEIGSNGICSTYHTSNDQAKAILEPETGYWSCKSRSVQQTAWSSSLILGASLHSIRPSSIGSRMKALAYPALR